MLGALVLPLLSATAAGPSNRLDFLPAPPLERQLYSNASLQTWGGNVIEDDEGGFHLYAVGFGTYGCGLGHWLTNSDVIHATAASPEGPFRFRDTAVPLWAHNPAALRAPDGTYLLYQMARRNCAKRHAWPIPVCKLRNGSAPARPTERLPCAPGTTAAGNTTSELCAARVAGGGGPCQGSSSPACHCDSHRIEIYSAASPNGPWKKFTPSPDLHDGSIVAYGSNPAPIFLPNGSIVVVQTSFGYNPSRNFSGALRVAFAQTWNSSYRNDLHLPFAPCHFCTSPPCKTCADCGSGVIKGKTYSGCGNLEDPTIWFDHSAQKYKLLAHSFMDGSDPEAQAVGAYAESKTADIFGEWSFDLHNGAYGMSATLENGSTIMFSRRERPHVFLNKDGSVRSLTNGVQLKDGRAFTFVQRVKSDDGAVIFQDFRSSTANGVFKKNGGRQNNMTNSEQTFVLALQGLANRKGARLYLNVSDENMSYNSSSLRWTQWLTKSKGLRFAPQHDSGSAALCKLVSQLGDAAKGIVLWDDLFHRHLPPPNNRDCVLPMRTLATTIAGLDDLLPATPGMLESTPCLQKLVVRRNLTAELDTADVFKQTDCAASANLWGLKQLLPKTNKTAIFAVSGNAAWVWLAADYAVQTRMFAFSLEPDALINSVQSALFQRILRSRTTPAAVFGWPNKDEGAGTSMASKAGCYVMCAAAENLSFFASAKADRTKLRLPGTTSTVPLNRSKNYITFQTNEGDTPKSAIGLQHGSWLDPGRGSAPVSWGWNPRMCKLFPIVCEYYATTATPNDSFFSHSSGYMNVWLAPEADLKRFAEETIALIKEYMPHSNHAIDVWTGSEYNRLAPHEPALSLANYSKYQRYAGNNVSMFTQAPAGFDNETATNEWLPDGTPIFMTPRYLHYVCEIPHYPCDPANRAKSIADRVVQALGGGRLPSPRFAMVYGLVGGMPGRSGAHQPYESIFTAINKVKAQLPEDVQVVADGEFVDLARESRP